MKNKRKALAVFAVLLAAWFCFASLSVFAQQVSGTEENPAEAAITKELTFNQGVSIPEKTFEFEFVKENINGDKTAAKDMPELSASIAFDGTEAAVAEGEFLTASAQSGNILENIVFPHAGVYEYTVKEKGTDDLEYGFTYSKAQYKMSVYVKNGSQGVYVYFVEVTRLLNDQGAEDESDVKVDPTPGDDNTFTFGNKYSKRGGEEMGSGEPSLTITNHAVGAYADKTLDFNYTVTFNMPVESAARILNTQNEVFDGRIVDKNGNYTGETVECAAGVVTQFELRHAETIVFDNIPAGVKCTVVNAGNAEYNFHAEYIENGESKSAASAGFGNPIAVENMLIGEKENNIDFIGVHYMEDALPTGISMENAPFVLLIAVSALFIAVYAVKRRRLHR